MADKPDLLVIWGDDSGIGNLSCCSDGLMVSALRMSTLSPRRGPFTDDYGEPWPDAGVGVGVGVGVR
jgi:arylsulfatase A-like enzyme